MDGEVKRACKQRRRAKRQPRSNFFTVVTDEVLDDYVVK